MSAQTASHGAREDEVTTAGGHGAREGEPAATGGPPPPLLISEGSPGRDDLLRCLAAMERTHPLAASCLKAIATHEEFVALMADLAALSASGALEQAPKPGERLLADGESYTGGGLRAAVEADDLATAASLLERGVDPNSPDETLNVWSPLHFAAKAGNVAMAELLLRHGANPLSTDRLGLMPLDHAGFWAKAEVAAALQPLSGQRPPPPPSVLLPAEAPPPWLPSSWNADSHITIICSAPEYSLSGFEVMTGLFDTCRRYPERVQFGYDWGGSSSADDSDSDPNRIVYACCRSVACTCRPKGAMIIGKVDWSDPESVMGSQWYPKYMSKVKAAISAATQLPAIKTIEMIALDGGPVTRLEQRTLPKMIADGAEDVRGKGTSISVAGAAERTDIKIFLRPMGYLDFFRRFDDEWLRLYAEARQGEVKVSAVILQEEARDGAVVTLADRCLVALVYVGGGTLPKLLVHGSVQHVAAPPQLELPLAAAVVTEDAAAGRLSVTVSAEVHP